jgi:hypothetical protein
MPNRANYAANTNQQILEPNKIKRHKSKRGIRNAVLMFVRPGNIFAFILHTPRVFLIASMVFKEREGGVKVFFFPAVSESPSRSEISQDHFISPLGCLAFRFEFNCGAVPPGAGEPVAIDERDCSRSRMPLSLLFDDGSSLLDGAAMEERDVRSIDVLGRRLLLVDAEPLECSALVRRGICGIEPSLLRGR